MKSDKTKIYFTCPVPTWVEGFDTPEKCNFWEEYLPYRNAKDLRAVINEIWVKNIPEWKLGLACLKCKDDRKTVVWRFGTRHQICYSCIRKHRVALKREYEFRLNQTPASNGFAGLD